MSKKSILNNNFILVVFTTLAIPALFYKTTEAMIHVWMVNETFTHGFLIFPITLWLIWQKKDQLNAVPAIPETKAFVLLIPLLAGWLISSIVDVQVVQQFIMIAIIITIIWIIIGRHLFYSILFPLLFLFFAVPFGQSFIPPLMEFTAFFTVNMIHLTGIPIYQEGLFLSLPSGEWSVVEECSGVRYLIASLTLGTLYAYLSYTSFKKRLIFILISILVPILANGFRAFGIVMIGHLSGMKLATGVDHLLYGWVFFGFVIFLLFYFGKFWWDPIEDNTTVAHNNTISSTSKLPVVMISIALSLSLSTRLLANQIEHRKNLNITPVTLKLPDNFAEWQYSEFRSLDWQLIVNKPDAKISKSYIFGSDIVQLNIGYYQSQRKGSEAIATSNRVSSPVGGEWGKVERSDIQENEMYFSQIIIKNAESVILVWQWYKIGSYQTPNPYIAKVLDAYNIIFAGRTDASMLTIATPILNNKEYSQSILREFIKDSANDIHTTLDQLILK